MGRLHRLPNYDYGQEGCYFITFCTKRRAPILIPPKIEILKFVDVLFQK